MNITNQGRLLYINLIVAVLAVACKGSVIAQDNVNTVQSSDAGEEPPPAAPTPTEVLIEPTPPAENTGGEVTEALADPVSVCPEPTADTRLYVDETNGYCLLYPASFSLESGLGLPALNANAVFRGAVVGEGVMGEIYATLWVNVIGQPGAAKGYSAADYVDLASGELSMLVENLSREDITLPGGQPAVIRQGVAILPFRALYVAVHDTLYEVRVEPDSNPGEALAPEVELAWTTMLDSLTFFPPAYSEQVLIPEQVCPTATADTYLFIDRWDGYCVLVPNSFEETPDYGRGWFIGGPELTGLSEVSRVEAVIVMQDLIGETVGQVADDQIENAYDSGSITRTDTTVSGCPAVFLDRPQNVIPNRYALIDANGYLYTLIVHPIDPVNYPEAVEPAELVWNTFIDSIAFFEPWQ